MRIIILSLSMSLVAVLAAPGYAGNRAADGVRAETRALWVTRWDYKTPDDIRLIMERARLAHFNVIFFQVRGNADAFYDSRYEPWAEELGGRHPGFDPLSVAIQEAHRRGLELHAYINVLTGWKGSAPPRSTLHLWRTHHAWFTRNVDDIPQPLGNGYLQVTHGMRYVRDHIVNVVDDIVRHAAVDDPVGPHQDGRDRRVDVVIADRRDFAHRVIGIGLEKP